MPLPLLIAGVTAAVGAGTAIAGFLGASNAADKEARFVKQASAIGLKMSKLSGKIEQQRKLQMRLEAMRQRREIVRNMISARAEALSNATLAGAGASSGLQGGLAQESAEGTRQLTDVYTSEDVGKKIFNYNTGLTLLGGQLNQVQAKMGLAQSEGQFNQGLISAGMSIMGSAATAGKVGGSLFE